MFTTHWDDRVFPRFSETFVNIVKVEKAMLSFNFIRRTTYAPSFLDFDLNEWGVIYLLRIRRYHKRVDCTRSFHQIESNHGRARGMHASRKKKKKKRKKRKEKIDQ